MVAAVAGCLLLVVPGAVALAGSVSQTQSQLTAVEAQVAAESGEIHQLTQRFAAATTQATSLQAQLATEETSLRSLQRRLAASRAALTQSAISSYIGDQVTVPVVTSAGTNPAVRAEYLDIAAGAVRSDINTFQLQQREVTSAEGAIRSELAADRAAASEAVGARNQALDIASTEQARLASLQTQLANENAAQKTQGGPVNNGLVDVVRHQTSTAPSTTTTTTTSPPSTTAPTTPTTTTPPTTPPSTAPPTTTPPTTTGGNAGGVWLQLRICESGDNYQENTGNGFYGAYQFTEATWTGLGYPGRPDLEPPAMQDAAAMKLQAEYGWGQWPACAKALGLT